MRESRGLPPLACQRKQSRGALAHDRFSPRRVGQRADRNPARRLDVWTGPPLGARRKTAPALCRIQRHPEHWLRRSRAGNASQVRHVLGASNVDFSVMTQDFNRSRGYFESTRQVYLPDVFPPFLFHEVSQNHGVIACEGSMFKSKFANALTTMMIGSLGLASAENKLSLAYAGVGGLNRTAST